MPAVADLHQLAWRRILARNLGGEKGLAAREHGKGQGEQGSPHCESELLMDASQHEGVLGASGSARHITIR
jgi:hypothetical protein